MDGAGGDYFLNAIDFFRFSCHPRTCLPFHFHFLPRERNNKKARRTLSFLILAFFSLQRASHQRLRRRVVHLCLLFAFFAFFSRRRRKKLISFQCERARGGRKRRFRCRRREDLEGLTASVCCNRHLRTMPSNSSYISHPTRKTVPPPCLLFFFR